jgi:hypothetical protein
VGFWRRFTTIGLDQRKELFPEKNSGKEEECEEAFSQERGGVEGGGLCLRAEIPFTEPDLLRTEAVNRDL